MFLVSNKLIILRYGNKSNHLLSVEYKVNASEVQIEYRRIRNSALCRYTFRKPFENSDAGYKAPTNQQPRRERRGIKPSHE